MQVEDSNGEIVNEAYETRIESLQRRIDYLEHNLHSTKSMMQGFIENLERSNDDLAIQRNAARAQVSDLETALANVRAVLQGFIEELTRSNDELATQRNMAVSELNESGIRFRAIESDFRRWHGLRSAHRLIELDFPVRPRVRYGETTAGFKGLRQILAHNDDVYERNLKDLLQYSQTASLIEAKASNSHDPSWVNDWFPAFDALSVYAFLAKFNPKIYLEIGSGNSTKFARRAINDFSLRTKIISIDPFPRTEIDDICDEIIRLPLEDVDHLIFSDLSPGDMVFCDSSHRSFQNSDVTVFFMETIQLAPLGVLFGIHDIFLPYDYPEDWLTRHYNEQYLLGCLILGSNAINIELPVRYCCRHERLKRVLDPAWSRMDRRVNVDGGAFWFRLTRSLITG